MLDRVSPTATTAAIVLERRFNGPLSTANGGYACGRVARFVDGPAEVTLRRPVPLDAPLDVERHDDGLVTVHHAGELVAEGAPALPVDLEPPRRPSVEEAFAAVRAGWANRHAAFANCYVCSATRADGLGVDFGPLPSDPSMTGAVLLAGDAVPQEDGAVAPEIVWAALDCPSYAPALWADERPSLLARLTADVREPIAPGEPVVAVGWSLRSEGRKHHSASALIGADGRLLAVAQALWIRVR